MEKPTKKTISFFPLFTLFLSLLSTTAFSSPKPLFYQTLVLNPLSKPLTPNPTLPWSHSETVTESESEIQTQIQTQTSLYLRLEHRDSLATNSTPEELFQLRLQRDSFRVQALSSLRGARNATAHVSDFSSTVISGLSQGSGEYFTRIGVGTPPKYAYMVLDTGSDIVWLQCAPCRKCYTQTDPVFDPSKSRSFSTVRCGSPLCRRLDVSGCSRRRSCLYQVCRE